MGQEYLRINSKQKQPQQIDFLNLNILDNTSYTQLQFSTTGLCMTCITVALFHLDLLSEKSVTNDASCLM